MGRAPCCDKANVKRGPWSPEEDATLRTYVETHGTGGNWIALPRKAGLRRCGKSCRLRWLNYLRPNIKHGGFTEEEDHIICNLYNQMGSRWSVIASQLPGRTDNDVKNYWNTKLKKKLLAGKISLTTNSNPIPINSTSITSITNNLSRPKPSFQPPCVPKLETNIENSASLFPNSQNATLRMLSADINYNVPGLTTYDQRLNFNNPIMDFSNHQFDVNSKKQCDIINGSMSQEGSSISDSSNSMAAIDHHHNFKRTSILRGINGCDEYGTGTTMLDFGYGLLPYDIVNDMSFEEKAYNSISTLADHQSIINNY